jgi:hypothetical protein
MMKVQVPLLTPDAIIIHYYLARSVNLHNCDIVILQASIQHFAAAASKLQASGTSISCSIISSSNHRTHQLHQRSAAAWRAAAVVGSGHLPKPQNTYNFQFDFFWTPCLSLRSCVCHCMGPVEIMELAAPHA